MLESPFIIASMISKAKKTLLAGAIALVLAFLPIVALALESDGSHDTVIGVAGAVLTQGQQPVEEEELDLPEALQGETDIEKLTIASDDAKKELQAAEGEVAKIQVEIDGIERILPEQEARSNAGIKQRYIMQSNPLAIAEPLLSAQTLDEFIRQVDYLQLISEANLKEFNKTCDMKDHLDAAKAEQVVIRDKANAEYESVQGELEELQDERAEKQEKAQEKAISQVDSESERRIAAQKRDKKDEDADEDDEDSDDEDSDEEDEDEDADEEDDGIDPASKDTEGLVDGADWHAHRDEFIAEWAERLDDYLEGSALEGQGENFAASAWKYCIDPRWSAAISNTESSKGAFCIRPHNAWGWGAADSDPYNLASEWDSWEEAIDAHAKGLAKGYGYTITMRGAQSYCPNTWQSWYNKTLAEMEKI